ncbi:MAG: hypothetical protein GKR87_06765 [Kiritimatiellae bacterium]|nr:hypothetical protein [Kiritimatiellia bacterium]
MPKTGQSSDQLFVAIQGDLAFVRVVDRGSFKISTSMKNFGTVALEQGVVRIVIDMSRCVGMDSTFMGVIAGLAFRLKELSGGEICMVNLTARTRNLLSTLGLDNLVRPYMTNTTPDEFKARLGVSEDFLPLHSQTVNRRDTAAMMLEAHEKLVQLTPENVCRFKDVLTFLREDLEKASAKDQRKEHL